MSFLRSRSLFRRTPSSDSLEEASLFHSHSRDESVGEFEDIKIYDGIFKKAPAIFDEYLAKYKWCNGVYFLSIMKTIDKFDCRITLLYELLPLHEKMSKLLERLKDVEGEYVQDILFLSLIQFYRIDRNQRNVKLMTLQITSIDRVFEVLSTYKDSLNGTSKYYYWSVLRSKQYSESTLVQRMFILSQVLNFKQLFYEAISNDGLYDVMLNRKDLFQMMLQCSGKFEQSFLNSCTATTVVNEILVYNHTISSYFIMSSDLIKRVQLVIEEVKHENVKEYAQKLLDRASQSLTDTRIILQDMLGSSVCDEVGMRNVILAWSKSFQEICLLLDPDNIAAPTQHSLKGNYKLSSALTFFNIILNQDKDEVPVPKLQMYAKGADLKDIQKFLDNYFIIRRITDPSTDFSKSLWTRVILSGGTPVARDDQMLGSHQMYLRATFRRTSKTQINRFFMIYDPLVIGIEELALGPEIDEYARKCKLEIE